MFISKLTRMKGRTIPFIPSIKRKGTSKYDPYIRTWYIVQNKLPLNLLTIVFENALLGVYMVSG